ncbi:MAG: Rnase Y domain-containing protein, partial [Patescibacteria group bacterium]
MPTLITVLVLALGIAAGYYLRYLQALSKKSSIEIEIKEREVEAEKQAIEIIEKAEEKIAKAEQEAKAERKTIEEKLTHKEEHLLKREEIIDNRQIDLDSQRESLQTKIQEVKSIKAQLDERKNSIESKLQEIAGLTPEEAFSTIISRVEQERASDLRSRIEKLERSGSEIFEEKAQNLLLAAIHRVGNNIPSNVMTTHVEIPSDDLKGKVIGKEGRNVRAFERATGVDVLIDETPGYIVLSSFDPIRREIARVALEALLKDGRIQPAKIEESVELARKEVASIVRKMGEKAAYEANVPNLHPDLISILG